MQAAEKVRGTLLGHARYGVLVTHHGGGFSAHEGLALTRWAPDPLTDAAGAVCYLRDVETGAYWSVGAQPAGAGTVRCRAIGSTVHLTAEHDGVLARVIIAVAADAPLEVRSIRIENRTDRVRRIELTTYAELVLNTPAADAGHPAFSKLFVQTGVAPESGALLAWRRLRSPDDAPLHVAQRLITDALVEHETDRARFLGRGRGLAAPLALLCRTPLSGTIGNVLDPIFVQRVTFGIGAGAAAEAALVCAAGADADTVRGRVRDVAFLDDAHAVITRAAATATPAVLGLPKRWLTGIELSPALAVEAHLPAPATFTASAPASSGNRGAAGTSGGPIQGIGGAAEEELRLFNGLGGFSADGMEYVIRLRDRDGALELPPLPWTNCIANEELGCLVSERGATFTWAANSRENRITPWLNDPVGDPHGEALYLRDEASGACWSPLPGPAPAPGGYEVRHGIGYSRFRHTSGDLEQDVTLFVPRSLPVRVLRVHIDNHGSLPRRLSLYSYAQLVLGGTPQETRGDVETLADPSTGALLARNRRRAEFAGRVAFAAFVAEGDVACAATTDRPAFLGAGGDPAVPTAVRTGTPLAGAFGTRADPCFAHQCTFTVDPGAAFECALLLGEGADMTRVRECLHALDSLAAVDRELADVRAFWQDLIGRVHIATPSPALDLMVNGWLTYQNLSCRMWGRSAFYQSGGAFGFRDQLQDSAALLWLDPARTRAQLLLHAAHQFVEGDVLHWWHPPASKGIRTRFADDLLWLPFITAEYVRATGDTAVLDETTRYLRAPLLEPGEDEVFLVPEDSGERGTLYDHCCRALDRSLAVGAHGLPLMGTGDWNDGMNRVGREGRGESVWLGFFLFDILHRFLPHCDQRGDAERARRYRAHLAALGTALNEGGWDGSWYRRAYYDSGVPLGAASNDECRIDTIAQAWAVLSGAAPPERAEQALDAMEQHLVSDDDRIIRLLTPAFDRTPHDPGYIKGYLPGVRENGGQYTHGALWAVRALAEAGRTERAAPLLAMLSPVTHARTPDEVARYRTEPYVIAADVYGVEPHVGRGGWTWYTGSAGWMYRVALESVLGLELRGDALAVCPCIPADWPGFEVTLRRPEATCRIRVRRTSGRTRGVIAGAPLTIEDGRVLVPFGGVGSVQDVEIELGTDLVPRYRSRC